MQEAIFETLTREYELAKVQEAKEIPSVKMIDPPDMPEGKSYPPAARNHFYRYSLATFLGVGWVFADEIWEKIDPRDPQKVLALEIYQAARDAVSPGHSKLVREPSLDDAGSDKLRRGAARQAVVGVRKA